MLGAHDLKSFSDACVELYHPELSSATYAERATAFLKKLVSADVVCVGDLDPAQSTLGVDFSVQDSILPTVMDGFSRTMGQYKLFDWDPQVNDGKPFFRGDFYTKRQFKNLDVYSESFGLIGWPDHAALHVPTHDDHVIFMGLERAGGAEFSERDRLVLTLAQAQLTNARRLFQAHEKTLRDPAGVDPAIFRRHGFSQRESEVLAWLTEGKSNAEMSMLLGVSLQTVKFHLTSIFNKTGTGNRLAATLHALELIRRQQIDHANQQLHLKARLESKRL